RRRANTLVWLTDQLVGLEHLVGGVAPVAQPHVLVHHLSQRLSKAIRERLDEDRGEVAVRSDKAAGDFVLLAACRDHEPAEIIRLACLERRDEIRKRHAGLALALAQLLAQREE